MSLHFNGEWPPLPGISAACLLALAAFLIYHRETRMMGDRKARLLPWLRGCTVLILTLMLTGPVLRSRHTEGVLTRLLVFADCSQSMDVTDPEMDVVRKLGIARSLQWLSDSDGVNSAESAAEQMMPVIASINAGMATASLKPDDLHRSLEALLAAAGTSVDSPIQGVLSKDEGADVERQLLAPARKILAAYPRSGSPSSAIIKECTELLNSAVRLRERLLQKARAAAVRQAGEERRVAGALERLDRTPRIERIRSVLLDGAQKGLLAGISEHFSVELFALQGSHGRLLWRSADGLESMPASLPAAEGSVTDLGNAVLEQVPPSRNKPESEKLQGRTAIVLLSDGRHNAAGLPLSVARTLGDRGVPVYCIGTGSQDSPPDLSLTGVDAPETIFYEDRISGTANIRDDMPSGVPYQLRISLGDRVVWQKDLVTSRHSTLKVPFDFGVKNLVQSSSPDDAMRKTVVPLSFQAAVTILPSEREIRNNSTRFLVRATTGKRRMLLLDGRSRWDTRYLSSFFERDPQWQVNALVGDPSSETRWQRGKVNGTFPSDISTLNEYDLIVFGDVPHTLITDEEAQWIEAFASKRGGGVLFLDGARHSLAGYGVSPVARLLPVVFPSAHSGSMDVLPSRLELSERGRSLSTFKLEENASENSGVWGLLSPPKRMTLCSALPGTETLVEAKTADSLVPAIVWRQHGSGHVAYMAFDETWRWRKEVAGKHQERFWNQFITALAEPTFSTMDDTVALDTDSFQYVPGSTATLRARIRDGKSRTNVLGSLWRDGKKVAALQLAGSSERNDVFTGRTEPLAPGVYDFGVDGVEGQTLNPVRVRFEVAPLPSGELSDLTLNEGLLRQISEESHGAYLREERIRTLPDLLEPLHTGRVVESDVLIWQSYGLFALAVAFLALELALRKRLGLL